MSILKVTLPESTSAKDGLHVTFKAPCNSAGITKLRINNDDYELQNVYGESISEGDNLIFKQGAMVYVILDYNNHIAFLQNTGGVESFNGRVGAILPQAGDYTAAMVGAAKVDHTHSMDEVSGILDVTHGGTGVKSWDEIIAQINNQLVARFG